MAISIDRVELFHYRLPLSKPLRLSATVLTERESLLIKWHIKDTIYWTEIAPLPGYSQETLAEAEQQIRAFFKVDIAWSAESLKSRLATFTGALSPSVEMGLAAVFLELEANYFGVPKLCGLIAERDIADGCAAVASQLPYTKLKVGLRPLEEDIERIRRIYSQQGFKGKLRLDANQQWSREQVTILCEQIDVTRVQWLEDPLPPGDSYTDWAQFSVIPFALDETLYQGRNAVRQLDGLAALILKPSLLGMARTLALIEWAQQHGTTSIISSGFETPVGLRALYALANKYARAEYHGLDTLKYFEYQKAVPYEDALRFQHQLL